MTHQTSLQELNIQISLIAPKLSGAIGKANAISAKQLIHFLGTQRHIVTQERIRELVTAIRRRKRVKLLCSTTVKGKVAYYVPSSQEEAFEYVRQLLSKKESSEKLYAIMIDQFKEVYGVGESDPPLTEDVIKSLGFRYSDILGLFIKDCQRWNMSFAIKVAKSKLADPHSFGVFKESMLIDLITRKSQLERAMAVLEGTK